MGRSRGGRGRPGPAVALGAALTAPALGAVIARTSWGVRYAVPAAAGVVAVLVLRPLVRGEDAGLRAAAAPAA